MCEMRPLMVARGGVLPDGAVSEMCGSGRWHTCGKRPHSDPRGPRRLVAGGAYDDGYIRYCDYGCWPGRANAALTAAQTGLRVALLDEQAKTGDLLRSKVASSAVGHFGAMRV